MNNLKTGSWHVMNIVHTPKPTEVWVNGILYDVIIEGLSIRKYPRKLKKRLKKLYNLK